MLNKIVQLNTRKSQRGVLTLDTAFGIAIIIFLMTFVQAKSAPLTSKSEESLLIDGITHIIEGATNYKSGATDGYASMTIANLASGGYVPAGFALVNGNPVGGPYSILGATAAGYTIAAEGAGMTLCNRVAAKLSRFTNASCGEAGSIYVEIGPEPITEEG